MSLNNISFRIMKKIVWLALTLFLILQISCKKEEEKIYNYNYFLRNNSQTKIQIKLHTNEIFPPEIENFIGSFSLSENFGELFANSDQHIEPSAFLTEIEIFEKESNQKIKSIDVNEWIQNQLKSEF